MGTKDYKHTVQIDEDEEEVEIPLEDWKPPTKVKEEGDDEEEAPVVKKEEPEEEPEEAPAAPPKVDPMVLELRQQLADMQRKQDERDEQTAQGYAAYEVQQLDAKMAGAREKLLKAQEAGDTKAAIEATEELTDLKVEKKARELTQRQAPTQRTQPQQAPENPLTARWRAANPWFGNPKNTVEAAAVFAVDREMASEGWQPNTEDYFEELNRRISAKVKSVQVGSISTKKVAQPPKTAGVSPTRTVKKPGTVTLTSKDFGIMRMLGMDPNNQQQRKDYAKSKLENDND